MTENTITLAQVITEVGWPDRSSLVRLLDETETRTLLGVVPGPRPAYPRASLPVFKALREAHVAGQVKPKTAPQFLKDYIRGMPEHSDTGIGDYSVITISEQTNNSTSEQPNKTIIEQTDIAVPQAMIHILASAIRESLADIAPVREDRLLTRTQVAEILACSPGVVRKRVSPVGRGVWRWSDVMRYIATGPHQGD